MISLREAFKLCRIDDDEVVYLSDSIEHEASYSVPMTGKDIKNKYDMRNTSVTAIVPHGFFGFEGFAFIIKE